MKLASPSGTGQAGLVLIQLESHVHPGSCASREIANFHKYNKTYTSRYVVEEQRSTVAQSLTMNCEKGKADLK